MKITTRLIQPVPWAVIALLLLAGSIAVLAAQTEPASTNLAQRAALPVSEETLRRCVRNADLVVVGEIDPGPPEFRNMNVQVLTPLEPNETSSTFHFNVAEVLKGKAPSKPVIPINLVRSSTAHELVRGERLVLFLVPASIVLRPVDQRDQEAPWVGVSLGADEQPATPELVAAVKKLVATLPARVPSSSQLDTLLKQYLPGHTVRYPTEILGSQLELGLGLAPVLITPEKKEIDFAGALGEWQGPVVVPAHREMPGSLPGAGTYAWQNPVLTALIQKWNLRVSAASEAEDIARIIQALFFGSEFLNNWDLKTQPVETGWLVIPVFTGPPSRRERSGGPIELVVDNGMLKDVRKRSWAGTSQSVWGEIIGEGTATLTSLRRDLAALAGQFPALHDVASAQVLNTSFLWGNINHEPRGLSLSYTKRPPIRQTEPLDVAARIRAWENSSNDFIPPVGGLDLSITLVANSWLPSIGGQGRGDAAFPLGWLPSIGGGQGHGNAVFPLLPGEGPDNLRLVLRLQENPADKALEKAVHDLVEKQAGVLRSNLQQIVGGKASR